MNKEIRTYHSENDISDEKMKEINDNVAKKEADKIVSEKKKNNKKILNMARGVVDEKILKDEVNNPYNQAIDIVYDKFHEDKKKNDDIKKNRRSITEEKIISIGHLSESTGSKDEKYNKDVRELQEYNDSDKKGINSN